MHNSPTTPPALSPAPRHSDPLHPSREQTPVPSRKSPVNVANEIAYNDLPLDLPHAGRITFRLCRVIQNRGEESFLPGYEAIWEIAAQLNETLLACRLENEAPNAAEESEELRQEAARLGRLLVEEIEQHRLTDDRIGQSIRNLFECLALGREGATLSLRAGENPNSLQRP